MPSPRSTDDQCLGPLRCTTPTHLGGCPCCPASQRASLFATCLLLLLPRTSLVWPLALEPVLAASFSLPRHITQTTCVPFGFHCYCDARVMLSR